MQQRTLHLSSMFFLLIGLLCAQQNFPAKGWKPELDPIASQDAIRGGSITIFAGQSPKSFNYHLDNNSFTSQVFAAQFESLLDTHSITMEEQPNIAQRWSISADKKTFTFWLDPRATWSDGKAITAQDVAFTVETILNPKHLTGPHKIQLERFEKPQVVDDRQIKFIAKEVHWSNLLAIGGLNILPKHHLEGKDYNKVNFEFPVISGPYRLGKHRETVSLTMERNPKWWGDQLLKNKFKYNFDKMVFRFYADRNNAFEAFKGGEIDLFAIYTSKRWVKDALGKAYENNWIIKQRIHNANPSGFQGFAMNMRRWPFDDVKVRQALAHLLDRNKMNQQLMYNQYALLSSYYGDLYDSEHPNPNSEIAFDKNKARQLFKAAGWKVNPKSGLQEKDGKALVINFLTRSASSNRFLAIYREDLADLGITLNIVQKDWAAWAKDMDDFNYDMTWAAWGAGVRKDPEGMWKSSESERPSGVNITGFKNPDVDELIKRQKSMFNMEQRHEIVRKVDQLIFQQHPYALLWNLNYTRLLYWNKFGTPSTVLSKYGSDSSAYWYWWYEEDNDLDLEDAQEYGEALPEHPSDVYFDKQG